MQNSSIRLAVLQFVVYAVLGLLGFVAWTMTVIGSFSTLEAVVGSYLRGHFARWTAQFPPWGVLILASAALSLIAARLLQKLRREGAYLGVISFSMGFVTNILFAQNILVHSLIGILIGWTLLAPLIIVWKNLD